ncbi:MAG: polyamine ABC transporter substrate-binding protein [Rhodospirillales bacterium]|nr:polyamine ABC transporter substrate-binding protein [Rhodospirillales bacterium]
MLRVLSAWMLAFCVLLAVAADGVAADRTIKVYNWSDYIDESVLTEFTAKTGIKVVYDVYDSNDILETKLLAGNIGYDLVFPSGNFLARQIQAGIFQPLDRDKLTNWKNLDPALMQRLEKYDPGNKYGVPYLWGTTGIAFNAEMIKKRMPDAPVDSWRMIFDPEVLKHFADCGVYILDAGDEVIPAVLKFLGEDPDSKDPAVIAKAEPVLMAIRPYVRKFHSSENINALANGDICLALMWSGDAKIAAERAREAGKNFTVEYRIPREGAQMWFDMMAMPKGAPNPADATTFINYLLEPQVIAKSTNFVTYANPNPASKPYIDKAILDDPTIYPPSEVMEKLYLVTPYDQKVQRVITRVWQKVKTGK